MCRCLGALRNQVGAVKEILKSGQYHASVAVVPASSASDIRNRTPVSMSSKTPKRPPTPLLDSLGDFQNFGPLQCASLPQVETLQPQHLSPRGWHALKLPQTHIFSRSMTGKLTAMGCVALSL